jgi:putative addiction module component (TIGR02574 family)
VKTTALADSALKFSSKCSFIIYKLRFFASFRLASPSLVTFSHSLALSLPVTQRVELVELLLASLDIPGKTIDELWAKEADSRIDGFESGKIKVVSLENILSKYK